MEHDLRFARLLMAEIGRLQQLPKVQVERIVGPILGLFLPAAIAPCLAPLGASDGYEVVAPEFPLRVVDGNQSTNVDWLLVHRELQLVVLMELKTDRGSMRPEQGATYDAIRERVAHAGAGFLFDDLQTIRDASARTSKYDALIRQVGQFESALRSARRAVTLWLVPDGLDVHASPQSLCANFRHLAAEVPGELAPEWAVVREGLIALEHASRAERPVTGVRRDDVEIGQFILENLHRGRESGVPVKFWLGATGDGQRPNYQVEFADGSVRAFRHGGTRYPAERFASGKLRGPYPFGGDDVLVE